MAKLGQALIAIVLWAGGGLWFTAVGTAYFFLSLVIPPRHLRPVAWLACRGSLVLTAQRFELAGRDPDVSSGPYLYLFNHSSIMDAPAMVCAIPEHFGAIGKAEQFEIPGWGWLCRRWGMIPIDRSNLESAIRSLDRAGEDLSGGLSLLISPEGTRTKDGSLGPFKKGAFHVALQRRCPIIPVVIDGAFDAKPIGSWMLRPGRIRVTRGTPIHIEQGESVEALRDRVEAVFRRMLDGSDQSAPS